MIGVLLGFLEMVEKINIKKKWYIIHFLLRYIGYIKKFMFYLFRLISQNKCFLL